MLKGKQTGSHYEMVRQMVRASNSTWSGRMVFENGLGTIGAKLVAKMQLGAGCRERVTSVLKDLHLYCYQAQVKVLAVTFKVLNCLGPGYLKDCLLLYCPSTS